VHVPAPQGQVISSSSVKLSSGALRLLPLADSPGDKFKSATDPTTLAHLARSYKLKSLVAVTCLPAEHIPATAWHSVLLCPANPLPVKLQDLALRIVKFVP